VKDESKIKKQLISELLELQHKISELKRAETKYKEKAGLLEESEERYKALFNRSFYCVYVHDFEGNFLDANEAALNLVGYTKEDIPFLNFLSILEEDQLSIAFKTLEEIRQFGTQKNVLEYKLRKKSGDHVWVEAEGSLIYRKGEPYAIQGIARDITKRKLIEEKLRESEEQYRIMVETMNEGLSVVDRDGFITFVNPQFCAMTGYLRDELLGCHETMLLDAEDQRKIKLREIDRQRGDATPYEITLTRKDGGRVHTLVAPRPIFDEPGKFAGSLGIFTDITNIKQAEVKLLSHQERLSSLALELSLVEERQRRHIAMELQDQIGQTLAYCKARLENLREIHSLKSKEESIDEINALIIQMIQDTKLLTSQISTPILYEEGFEAAVKWLGDQFQKQYGLTFHFEEDGKPKPMIDETRMLLYQAVRELLVNVARHSHARNVKVSVQRDYRHILINVEDDGIGFDIQKIEPYIDKTAGFGLFSVHERLRYLGGDFKVESRPGHGTRFTLIVPLKHVKKG
jgi:PAS domain S-box-containing protein